MFLASRLMGRNRLLQSSLSAMPRKHVTIWGDRNGPTWPVPVPAGIDPERAHP